jgi:hypothetical protein
VYYYNKANGYVYVRSANIYILLNTNSLGCDNISFNREDLIEITEQEHEILLRIHYEKEAIYRDILRRDRLHNVLS